MHPVLFHIGRILIPTYGVVTAVGVLLALVLAQRTARLARVEPAEMWNLCILSMFSGLICERLVLLVVNWSVIKQHPSWALALAMVHHPLLTAAGVGAGAAIAAVYVRVRKMPVLATADALAPPLALGFAFEQLGALAAGSGYGIEASPDFRWAVTYTNPFAAIWSGTPLGVPLHPVQAYAAMAYLALAIILFTWLPLERRAGDVAGLWLLGAGAAIYLTELWRDPGGRGSVLRGALDGPQIAAVAMVLAGAFILREGKIKTPSTNVPRDEIVGNPGAEYRGPA